MKTYREPLGLCFGLFIFGSEGCVCNILKILRNEEYWIMLKKQAPGETILKVGGMLLLFLGVLLAFGSGNTLSLVVKGSQPMGPSAFRCVCCPFI